MAVQLLASSALREPPHGVTTHGRVRREVVAADSLALAIEIAARHRGSQRSPLPLLQLERLIAEELGMVRADTLQIGAMAPTGARGIGWGAGFGGSVRMVAWLQISVS